MLPPRPLLLCLWPLAFLAGAAQNHGPLDVNPNPDQGVDPNPQSVLVCSVTGPAVIDFHGSGTTVPDRCSYALLSTSLLQDVLLLADFQERRREDVSFLDSVTLKGRGFDLRVGQSGEVRVNGSLVTAAGVTQVADGVEVSLARTGVTTSFPLSKYQVVVSFDGDTAVVALTGPGSPGDDPALQGLCANSSEPLSSARVTDLSSGGCETLYSDADDSSINCSWAAARCALLRGAPFSGCSVDPQPFVTACSVLLCSYPTVDGLDCSFLSSYSQACGMQGSPVPDGWASAVGCVPRDAFCQNQTCSDHEFCGERFVDGTSGCFCRATFASKYTATGALGDPTVCGPSSASLTLVGCLLAVKGIDPATLHLNDPACRGQMDERTHMVTFSYDGSDTCGALVKANGSQVLYQNTIVSQNTSTDIITRRDQVYIDFSCVQMQPDLRTMSFRIKDNSVVQHITSGAWIYNLTMKAYTDPGLTQVVTSDYQVQLDQRIWVELRTDGLDDSLVAVVTDSCWATDQPSPDGSLRYDLIVSGCPNPTDRTVSVNGNGRGTSNDFSFNMFRFTGGSGDVYLHCELHLCVRASGGCAAVCSGAERRRRAVRPRRASAAAFVSMAWIN